MIMEEEKGKSRIFYNRRDEQMELENGEGISLLKACRLCFHNDEFLCQENLDELAKMFPDFNEYEFTVICTFLSPKLLDLEAEITGEDLLKLLTREEFTERERKESLTKLFHYGVLFCDEPTQDITEYHLTLTDEFVKRLRKSGGTFELKTNCTIGEIIFPALLKEETLFYNKDVMQSLEEIKDYLQPDNYRKIEEHYQKEKENLCFSVLMEGPSGTGKTAFVKEVARYTRRPVILVDIAKLRSGHWGEDEGRVRKLFNEYEYYCYTLPWKPILFVDECDTLLAARQNPDGDVNSSLVNGLNTVVEIWLQELDKFNGILFLTTNNANHMDEAIARRLLFQVHIGHPQPDIQVSLWRHFFPTMTESEAREMAHTTYFTGGQIKRMKDKVRLKEILYGPVPYEQLKRMSDTNGNIKKRITVGFNR